MAEDGFAIGFPDAPRAALDKALSELVERARDVLTTQGRLRALLRANQGLIEELEMPVVLRRIIEAAVELVGAQYGALGVIAPEGGLEQFITVGLEEEQAASIGHLPEGHGLLGALIEDPRPIRLEHLSSDHRAAGFPPHHPPMDSFLGVPIRIHGRVFGNLYLTNQATGAFTADDEELVSSLAATAGFVINNARLYAETRRRQEWTAATADLVSAILGRESSDPLVLIGERIRDLLHADPVELLRPSGDDGEYTAVALGDDLAEARSIKPGHVLADALKARAPRLVGSPGKQGHDTGPDEPGMLIPLVAGDVLEGGVLVARQGRGRFSEFDLELAGVLARQSAIAVQLSRVRAEQQRAELSQDRARIARDLHDLVIQQLFGAGLELQSLTGLMAPEVSERVVKTVDTLDLAIAQIRTVIFALSSRRAQDAPSIRHRMLDLASECGASMPKTPSVSFSGAVDLLVRDDLADDIIAVTREALTNIVKHAHAHNASVSLSTDGGQVVLEIMDDGVGLGASTRRSGLANLESRATKRGGSFHISDDSGTRICWTVPLGSAPSSGSAG